MPKFFGITRLFSVLNIIRDFRGFRVSAARMLGLDEWKAGNLITVDKFGNKHDNRGPNSSTIESWAPAVRLERKLEIAATKTKGNNSVKGELGPVKSPSDAQVYMGNTIKIMEENFFYGKRALVSGGGQGIGRAIVETLAKHGAKVIALDVDRVSLDNLKKNFPDVEILCANLCDWEATERAVKRALPVDLLVNNAGIAIIDPLISVTEEDYERTFNINVKTVVNVTRIVVADLIKRKMPGSIVTISSQASNASLLTHSLYCSSKGAIDSFTRSAALEYGPYKIRFNCVNPTIVMTELLDRTIWSNPEILEDEILEKIPLRRFAEIDDVVNAVIFLLCDKSSMITGSCISVDGGFLSC